MEKSGQQTDPWPCPVTGMLHAIEDAGRPYEGCYCINCDLARLRAVRGDLRHFLASDADPPYAAPEPTLRETVEKLRQITRDHDVKLPTIEDFLAEERGDE